VEFDGNGHVFRPKFMQAASQGRSYHVNYFYQLRNA
jgi:hypothetical protein